MGTEALAMMRDSGSNVETLWQGQQSACQIIRDHLQRLRALERSGVELHIRFMQMDIDERRNAVQRLYGRAEECGDEAIFRKCYRIFLSVCENPAEFPGALWADLREEVRAARNRLALRMARIANPLSRETNKAG